MWRNRFDRWLEHAIFGLLLLLLVFGPLAMGAVRPRDFLVIQWLSWTILALWAVRLMVGGFRHFFWPPVSWAVFAFVLYAFGRYLTADLEYVARQEWIQILVYGILFLAIVNNLTRPLYLQIAGWILLILAAGIAFYAVFQYLTNSEHVWGFQRPAEYAKRGSGTYICPNHLAGFLEMVLPLGVAWILLGRFRHSWKLFLAYLVALIFAGMIVSLSRGGWVSGGMGLGGLLLWWMWRRRQRLLGATLLAAIFIVATVFLSQAQLSQNRSHRMSLFGHAEDVRLLLWKPSWHMWMDHFWWGVGPNHFDVRFPAYRPAHRDLQTRPLRVHNDYLNMFVDWGLVGGLLVFWGCVCFWRGMVRVWPHIKSIQEDPLYYNYSLCGSAAGVCFGLLALAVHSLVDFNLHIPANAIVALCLAAWTTGMTRLLSVPNERTLSRPVRSVVLCGMLLAILYLGWQNVHRTQEVRQANLAERLPRMGQAQAEAWQELYAIEPGNDFIAYRIGESYRLRSWNGYEGYEDLAREAIQWFDKAASINPYDAYYPLRKGMCLDWLGQGQQAEPHYLEAHKLDPNGYYVTALVGWHYLIQENYAESQEWLERSIELYSANNFLAWFYLQRVKQERSAQ